MNFNCEVWPHPSHPAFPKETFHWAPLVNIKLIHQHSPPTKWIESFVDSGAPYCMFHGGICSQLGIKRVEDGIEDELRGVVGGPKAPLYFHNVKILVGSEQFETMAGFSWALAVGGLLGRRGLFENFIVRIDSSSTPPMFELEKIHRV